MCLGLTLPAPSSAADRAAEFLDGLRQRGWHDVALDYLESADEDPVATPEFLDRVDFERATTLALMARASVRDSERLDLNERAVAMFQSFAAGHQGSPQRLDALAQAGNLLAERALSLLAKADRLPSTATSQRDDLRAEARQTFDTADETVEQLLDACDAGLEASEDAEDERRPQLILKQAEARFLAANLLFDRARTYDAASEDAHTSFEAAAEAFAKLHSDYKGKLVGYYGRLYEGRARQALGDWEEALATYDDLIGQPISAPDFRRIVARAYRHRAECHLATNGVDDAIEECRGWLDDARGNEMQEPEWLAVAFYLAEALDRKSNITEGNKADRLRGEVRELYRAVAAHPGEFQVAARAALDAESAEAVDPDNVKTFADAFAAGKQALERMNSTKLAARLAESNNPDSVADLRRQAEQNQSQAQLLLETAVRLADEDAKLEDLLAARHYLCWIYWEEDRIPEAAVMGEYVARRYPECTFASSAAKVALAAWEKMYLAAKQDGDDGSYESANLAEMAELIAKVWPESPDASTAVSLLMQLALNNDRMQDAEALLARLPEESRGPAELNLGGNLWTRYLKQSAEEKSDTEQLQERATELLSSGYNQLRGNVQVTPVLATSVLYYVQALLAQGDARRAVAVLENTHVGPLVIAAGGSVEVQPAFKLEAYKAALRAYLSTNPPRQEKVDEIMSVLEEAIGTQDKGHDQLTRVYLGLGLELQRQIRELSDRGKDDEAQAIASSLEKLLEKITARGGAKDWKIRSWIAQTHLQLGAGLTGEAAERYLAKAEDVFRAMLDEAAKNPDFAPSELAVLGVRKQLGDSFRTQKKYDAALAQYVGVLREKPSMLDLQQEAAQLLQEWGQSEKKIDKLEAAIRGTEPGANKENLIWGWVRLAKIAGQAAQQAKAGDQPDVERTQKFQDLFFDAWHHVGQCRLQVALIATGEERVRQLAAARQRLESVKRLYPELGGPKWQQAFDELLKQIEATQPN